MPGFKVRLNQVCVPQSLSINPLNKKTLQAFKTFRVHIIEAPAHAVCCGVLNLLSQVGPYPETPPWLRPIALFLIGVRDPESRCWLKTEGATSRTQQGHRFLYHKQWCNGREKLII
jgi:hypothetical protein